MPAAKASAPVQSAMVDVEGSPPNITSGPTHGDGVTVDPCPTTNPPPLIVAVSGAQRSRTAAG